MGSGRGKTRRTLAVGTPIHDMLGFKKFIEDGNLKNVKAGFYYKLDLPASGPNNVIPQTAVQKQQAQKEDKTRSALAQEILNDLAEMGVFTLPEGSELKEFRFEVRQGIMVMERVFGGPETTRAKVVNTYPSYYFSSSLKLGTKEFYSVCIDIINAASELACLQASRG